MSNKLRWRLTLIWIGLFWACLSMLSGWSQGGAQAASSGVNDTVNFQGRLLSSSGAVEPDGSYNMEFKIYAGGPGNVAGDTGGTLLWTEDWLNYNSQGVVVKNGYFSVQLGAITPLPASLSLDNAVTWLSMTVASGTSPGGPTSAGCSSFASCNSALEPEMLPMKSLSSAPFALNAANANQVNSYGANNNFLALAVPASPTITVGTAGTSYYYVVTATNAQGETLPFGSVGLSSDTGIEISWAQVSGATGYRVYRNTTNAFTSGSLLLATVSGGQTTSYTDAGGATGTGLPPTSVTGTSVTVQGWSGQTGNVLQAENSSGSQIDTIDTAGNIRLASGAGIDSLTAAGTLTVGGSSSGVSAAVVDIGTTSNAAQTINIGQAAINTGAETVTIAAASTASGSDSVTVGSLNGASATTIQGGTGAGAIALTTGTNGSLAITANGSGSIALTTNSATSGTILKTATANSSTGFEVQNASSNAVLTVDTSNGQTVFGKPSAVTGSTVFDSLGGANAITLQAPATNPTASYSMVLPGGTPTAGQCLASSSWSAPTATLGWASCGGGGSTTLEQAYTASAGATPSITVTSALQAVSIENDSTSPITGQLFGVLDKGGAGTLFQVANTGATTIQTGDATNNYDSTTALVVQSAAGAAVFSVDTTNDEVVIGSGTTGEASPKLLVLDSGTSTADPTAVNGGSYYNTTIGTRRCADVGMWVNCNSGLLDYSTANSTAVSNCTTACPAFDVSAAIPANFCLPGRVLHLLAFGVMSGTTVGGSSPSIGFGVFAGASTTQTSDVQVGGWSSNMTYPSSSTWGWHVDFYIMCLTTGVLGTSTQKGNGSAQADGSATTSGSTTAMNTSSTTSFDTTTAENFYIAPVFGKASTSNTATLTQLFLYAQ